MRLRKSEIFSIVFGSLVFLLSAYLFIQETDTILSWMGLDRYAKRPKIAEVEVIRNMVRKKEYEMPEFRSIERKQTVYAKDSVMTGEGSAAVLRFLEGTVIELGPDALVLVETRGSPDALGSFELVLDVKKGEVTGKSESKKVKVVRNHQVIQLPQPKKDSLVQEVIEKKVIEKPSECRITSWNANKSQASALFKCDEGAVQKTLKMTGPSASEVQEFSIGVAPNHTAKWLTPIRAPGQYKVELVQKLAAGFGFHIEEREQTLQWEKQAILCEQSLKYIPSGKPLKRLFLEPLPSGPNLDVGKVSGGVITKTSALKPPFEVRLVEEYEGGFKNVTPPLKVERWRACPVLRSPTNGASEKSIPGRGVLFTWVSMGTSEQYLFEISKTPQFNKPIYSKRVMMNFVRVDPPVRGRIYWRVVDPVGKESSPIYQLVVK